MTRAIYARVSSDRQEHEETVHSQLAELRTRVAEDEVVGCRSLLMRATVVTTWYGQGWITCVI